MTFTRSTDDPEVDSESLSTQIIREHPKFGRGMFPKNCWVKHKASIP